MQTSIFSERLAALLKYSLKLDAGIAVDGDFVELQRLEARIVNDCQTGYYPGHVARALSSIAANIHQDFRTVLKLDK